MELTPYCIIAFLKCLSVAKISGPKFASRRTIIVLKPYCMDLESIIIPFSSDNFLIVQVLSRYNTYYRGRLGTF
jgi:hypothetical protein